MDLYFDRSLYISSDNHNHYHRKEFDIIQNRLFDDVYNLLCAYRRENKLLSIKDRSKHLIKLNPKTFTTGVIDYSWCFPENILKIYDVLDTNAFTNHYIGCDPHIHKLDPDDKWIILEDVPDVYNILNRFFNFGSNLNVGDFRRYRNIDISSIANIKHVRYENPFWSNARLIIIGHIYPSSSSSSSSLLFDNDNNTIDKGNKIIGFDSIPYEIILIIVKYITYSAIYTKYCNNCDKILKKVLLCSKCKICHYCDVTCQKADWNKRHKKICTDFLKYGWVK